MSTDHYADVNNLGQPSTTPVDRPLRGGWLERHRRYCSRAAQGNVNLVFLGDSLTQRWEFAPAVWQKYYAHRNAVQMGIDNDGTQQILWRIDHGTLDGIQPELIVLLIGINNIGNDDATPEQVRDGVVAILERIRKKMPRSKALVIGLLPYDFPGTAYGARIKSTNRLLAQLADEKMVRFIDIGDKLLVDGKVHPEIQPDGAHLSEKGYAIYAEAIEPKVRELMSLSASNAGFTPVITFSDTNLANGKPVKSADLNDLVTVREFQTDSPDVPFYANIGSNPAPVFLMVARQKNDLIGFKLAWPFDPNSAFYAAMKVSYGVDIWDPVNRKWELWVDKTLTAKQSEEMANAQGTRIQVVSVQLNAPRPGTYRFNIGRGGNQCFLGSLAYDPVTGKYASAVGFTSCTSTGDAGGLTQDPVYFYIPKGTRRLDLETWDPHKGKIIFLYKGLPSQKPTLSRKVDVSEFGTYKIELEPGEDGTVVMMTSTGFAFPYLYSIPILWAKSPVALLVPRGIAEADGLTIMR